MNDKATNVPTLSQHTDHAKLTPDNLTTAKGEDQTARQLSKQGLTDKLLTQNENIEFTQKASLLRSEWPVSLRRVQYNNLIGCATSELRISQGRIRPFSTSLWV